MSKRKRVLRAAEILLIAVFLIVLFLVEKEVITTWFSTSMNNALRRLDSSMTESSEKNYNDFKQQIWSERQVANLAAYFLENDSFETESEESLANLCGVFNVEGAYIIDRSGKVMIGCGVYSKRDTFKESWFEPLRTVSEKEPVSEAVFWYMLPDEFTPDSTDSYPLFLSRYMDSRRILVLERRIVSPFLTTDQPLPDWDGVVSDRVFGSDSFCFATYQDSRKILFLSEEEETKHPDFEGTNVPEQVMQDGFRGFVRLRNGSYFCYTKRSADSGLYYYCVVPAASLYFTTLLVSVSVLVIVFFFLLLMRMYTRLLLPDAIRNSKKKEPKDDFRKHLWILLLTAVIVTLAVNVFFNTLYLYTERIQTDSEQSAQLSEILDGFEEKQQKSSIVYNYYIATVTQAAADLIPQNPEFMKLAKLQELADVMWASRILIYDNDGTVVASNRNYVGLSLSDDPESMSYEFRWVLRGEPLLIQDKPDGTYLKHPYRFSGASLMDLEGNFIGMVQIAMDPSVYETMESSLSMETILSAFESKQASLVLAVDSENGKVFSPNDRYLDETAESLGISEEVLQDGFTGFFDFRNNKMIGSCHDCKEYHVLVASPTETIPASGFRYGVLTALPGIFTEVAFFLILIFYLKSCRSMTEEEIRLVERGRKKETVKVGEQMHVFVYQFIYILSTAVSLLYFFRYTLFEKDSVEYYIYINNWARGFHIFSIARCLIYIAVAIFVLATVSKLFTAIASLLMSRQETYIRMGLSFFKYGVGIATVFICASLLGAPTASLLASAGVLSVVLSFGAQNIVADIISGLFIVFEGTFKVGDMITVDDWHGQVQEIGIRNTKIRDLISEDMKIMNNSTIRTIINYSERPCWAPIFVGVDYATDIPALEAAFEREKVSMKKNIPSGIGDIVYMGIDELSDSQMTLKFQILCRNQDQPKVKRALNREIRMMFARNGITIPFPQVTLSSRESSEEEKTDEEKADEE